jgi:translocation and assembly module TamB
MSEPAGVTFKFNGNLPSMLLQDAQGQVQLEGRYSGSATHPLLELQMHAVDFSWNGLSVDNLAVSTAAAATTESPAVLQLDASSLVWKDVLLEDLSLTVKPVGEGFELRLMLAEKDVALNSVMLLTPENRNFDLNGNWQGVLTGFDVGLGTAYSFGLLQPAAFVWSSGSLSMEPLCLSESAGPSLCVDIDYQANGDWSLIADTKAVPLDYLRDFLELDVQFEQSLEGHLEWHQLHGQAPTGGAEFRITAGRILDLLDDEVLARTNEGRFAFTLQNGNLESGVLDIELPEIGFIDVNFDVLDIAGDGQRKLQGRAITRLDKLTLAGQVALPGVNAVDGQFESDIEISGRLANPEFDGGFKISNGLIDYAPIGLKLEDIEIQGQVQNRDRGDFSGSFRAGEGLASISGNFQFDDAGRPQLAIELAGDQLLLINTDALKIFADPELKIALASNRMDINGHITIPKASLTPEKLEIEEVRDSEDLVIENGETAPDAAAVATPAKNRIFGQLEVTLGKDVLVKVPDIEARITGSTVFNWKGETVPMAKGSYRIRGKVDVYGPTLRITNGTVSFPDVPADNPLLNIRAGRDIYGNTQIRSAGVQVIGSLRHPVLEAYTVPVTNEDRAWALLVTGNDFDQSQGVSGFDLGTYIAPKLYVSYGISLFQDENVISARYDLKKGFGVKVTSGQRETGLDISYTIDR